MTTSWPIASYFDDGTATARAAMAELELIEQAGWYELYRRRFDDSYWRIAVADKYQQRFLIRIDDLNGWSTFDSGQLEQQLLLQRRGGLGRDACVVQGCDHLVVLGSAFCLAHTYERGIRK